jgi:hypothetical protein
MKFLMQADLVSKPNPPEEKQIMVGDALMWRGRAYIIVDAESRESAFSKACVAGIDGAKGWGIAAEGDAQIAEAINTLGIAPYWTTADAAKAWGITEIRVRQFCQAGRVKMASKSIDGANVVWRFPPQDRPEKIKPGKKGQKT